MYHHFNYKFFSELAQSLRHASFRVLLLKKHVMIITTFDLRGRERKKRSRDSSLVFDDEVQTVE